MTGPRNPELAAGDESDSGLNFLEILVIEHRLVAPSTLPPAELADNILAAEIEFRTARIANDQIELTHLQTEMNRRQNAS